MLGCVDQGTCDPFIRYPTFSTTKKIVSFHNGQFFFHSDVFKDVQLRHPLHVVTLLGKNGVEKVFEEIGFRNSNGGSLDLDDDSDETCIRCRVKREPDKTSMFVFLTGPARAWNTYYQRLVMLMFNLSSLVVYSSYCGLDVDEKKEFEVQFTEIAKIFRRIGSVNFKGGSEKPNFVWLNHDVRRKELYGRDVKELMSYGVSKLFQSTEVFTVDTFSKKYANVTTADGIVKFAEPKEGKLAFSTGKMKFYGQEIDEEGIIFIVREYVRKFNQKEVPSLRKIVKNYGLDLHNILRNKLIIKYTQFMDKVQFPVSHEELLSLHNTAIELVVTCAKQSILKQKMKFVRKLISEKLGNKLNEKKKKRGILFWKYFKINKKVSIQKSNDKLIELYLKNVGDVTDYDNIKDFRNDLQKFKFLFLNNNLGPEKFQILSAFLRDEKNVISEVQRNFRSKKAMEKRDITEKMGLQLHNCRLLVVSNHCDGKKVEYKFFGKKTYFYDELRKIVIDGNYRILNAIGVNGYYFLNFIEEKERTGENYDYRVVRDGGILIQELKRIMEKGNKVMKVFNNLNDREWIVLYKRNMLLHETDLEKKTRCKQDKKLVFSKNLEDFETNMNTYQNRGYGIKSVFCFRYIPKKKKKKKKGKKHEVRFCGFVKKRQESIHFKNIMLVGPWSEIKNTIIKKWKEKYSVLSFFTVDPSYNKCMLLMKKNIYNQNEWYKEVKSKKLLREHIVESRIINLEITDVFVLFDGSEEKVESKKKVKGTLKKKIIE